MILRLCFTMEFISTSTDAPEESSYSGLFCDKKIFRYWMGQRGCGCYNMNQRRSNLVFDHTIRFVFNNTKIKMQNFSSANFSNLYLTSNLPPSVRARDLRMTEDCFNLLDHIELVVDLINNSGGFNITGWYKCSIINSRLLVSNETNSCENKNDEDIKVAGNEINYNIVELQPTDRDILSAETNLGRDLNTLKYDVNLLQID